MKLNYPNLQSKTVKYIHHVGFFPYMKKNEKDFIKVVEEYILENTRWTYEPLTPLNFSPCPRFREVWQWCLRDSVSGWCEGIIQLRFNAKKKKTEKKICLSTGRVNNAKAPPKKVIKFCSLALENIFSNRAASVTMCHHTFLNQSRLCFNSHL